MTVADLAARIDAHMKRGIGVGARATYDPNNVVFGGPPPVVERVVLKYSFGCPECDVDATTAEPYLAWLDAGGVGRHFEMEQEKPPA